MTRRFHLSARLAAAGALIAALAVVLVVSACETRKAEAACNAVEELEATARLALMLRGGGDAGRGLDAQR